MSLGRSTSPPVQSGGGGSTLKTTSSSLLLNGSPTLGPSPSTPGPNTSPSGQSGGGGGTRGSGGSVGTVAIAGHAVVAIVALALLAIVWICMARKRPKSKFWTCFGCCGFVLGTSYNSMRADLELQWQEEGGKRTAVGGESHHKSHSRHVEGSKSFTYQELEEATKGFSPKNLLGEGGFGRVYKGTIDGQLVAVKQLKIGSRQGEREFIAEMEIISRVHHRHLVSLVGFCISDVHRLLVYKFVPNGTLEEALHGPDNPVMDWPTRMNVALGTARGLAYLHEDCRPRIIHRDIKGSNILLDSEYEALVADFGLARLADDTQTHVTTRVMGTFGYVAPEYAMSGKLTDRSDVYSFGVVLLELITGKKPVDRTLFGADGESSLVEWARPLLTQALVTRNIEAFVDPNLKENYDEEEMARMVNVAAACVCHSSQRRPKMVEALRNLSAQGEDLHKGSLPGSSKEFLGPQGAEDLEQMRIFQQMVYSSRSTTQSSGSDSRSDGWARSASSNELPGGSTARPAGYHDMV